MSTQTIYPARSRVPIPQGVVLPTGERTGPKPGVNPYPKELYVPWMMARADEIRRGHKGTKKDNVLVDDANFMGVLGEYFFQWWSYIPMNLEDKPEGDGKKDFVTPLGTTIDVKTTKGNTLYRPVGPKWCDIFVLGKYFPGSKTVKFLGWCYDEEAVKYEPKINPASEKNNKPLLSHPVPASELRSMMSLWRLLQEGKI